MTNQELLQQLEQFIDQRLEQKLEQHIAPILTRLDRLEDTMGHLEETVKTHSLKLDRLEETVKTHSLKIDFEIMPILNDLSSCYLDTYKRYLSKTEQIDKMQDDVNVLKTVVAEHSEKLAYI